MSEIKVSIITPVYNAAPYLKEYMDCVLNQTMSGIEVIMVDDCSTDDSVQIIKKYQETNNNITLIESDINEGACRSKDKAIKIATGEYLFIIDSDDVISLNAVQKLYEVAKANDADITIGSLGYFYEGESKMRIMPYSGRSKVIVPGYPVYNITDKSIELFEATTNTQVCKLIKRSIVEKDNIINSDYRISTDMRFSFECMMASDKVVYVDEELYFYRQARSGSISSGRKKKKSVTHNILMDLYDFLKSHHYSEAMEDAFWRFFIHKEIQAIFESSEEYREEIVQEIRTIIDEKAVPFYEGMGGLDKLHPFYENCLNRIMAGKADKEYGDLLCEYRVEKSVNPIFTKLIYKRGRLTDYVYDDRKLSARQKSEIVKSIVSQYLTNH